MVEYPTFPNQLAEQIVLVIFRIFTKYVNDDGLNYTYYTAQKTLPIFHIPENPNLNKFYLQRGKKIEQHLIKEIPFIQDNDKELEFVYH